MTANGAVMTAKGSIVTYRDREWRVLDIIGRKVLIYPASPSEADRIRGPLTIPASKVTSSAPPTDTERS